MPFTELGLSPTLVRAAHERHYDEPTPIQAAAIPPALAGRDLLASAQTGSGKTAAYALALLQQLDGAPRQAPRRTHALVLVPTRELVIQSANAIRDLERHMTESVKVAAVFGGVSINPQMMALRGGADVVVATPGRLLDLVAHNALKLGELSVLVLDEADRLLDAGFADELGRVLGLLPKRRQNLMFSATFPAALQTLARTLLHDPVRIDVPGDAPPQSAIEQHAVRVDTPRRTQLLRHLIREGKWSRVLVFVATQYSTEHVAGKLCDAGLQAAAFHGALSQGARTRVLGDLKSGKLQVVVTTDLAARGIDIVQLPVVVNYDLPRSAVDHVHRIGRTGRAGARGLAVSFVTADAEAHFRLIEKRQGQRLERETVPGFEPTEVVADAAEEEAATAAANGGVKGKRPSKKDKLREAAARQGPIRA